MPIYAYKCSACGHMQDVLQKMSAEPLTVCPACGQSAYAKQVTAPQFQLKGSGWYVTDFRGGNAAAPAAEAKDGGAKVDSKADAKADAKTESKTDSAAPSATPSSTPAATPATPAKAPAASE